MAKPAVSIVRRSEFRALTCAKAWAIHDEDPHRLVRAPQSMLWPYGYGAGDSDRVRTLQRELQTRHGVDWPEHFCRTTDKMEMVDLHEAYYDIFRHDIGPSTLPPLTFGKGRTGSYRARYLVAIVPSHSARMGETVFAVLNFAGAR